MPKPRGDYEHGHQADDRKFNPYAAGSYLGQYKMIQKSWKMTETLTNGYSSESTHQELSNEYQHDRVSMIFKKICILILLLDPRSLVDQASCYTNGLHWEGRSMAPLQLKTMHKA